MCISILSPNISLEGQHITCRTAFGLSLEDRVVLRNFTSCIRTKRRGEKVIYGYPQGAKRIFNVWLGGILGCPIHVLQHRVT